MKGTRTSKGRGSGVEGRSQTNAIAKVALLVGVMMVLVLLLGVTTRTASAIEGSLRIESDSATVGQTVSVGVHADVGPPGLGAWTVDITYDNTVVSAVGCTVSSARNACNTTFGPQTVLATGAHPTGLIGDSTLATLAFRCERAGTSQLSISVQVLADATQGNPQNIELAAQNGTITCAPGDCSKDNPTICGVPPCPPDVLCIDPIECPTDEPCGIPGEPPTCPDGTICIDPVPCPDDRVCPAPPPCETDRPCDFDDTDGDGWQDFTENEWGSNPNDANSTPEHGYIIETCLDGIDNDGDGSIDLADSGCNIDSDEDGRIDAQDNCPWDANADQADRDGDGTGDACDYDADNDGWDDFTEAEWGSNPNDANSTPEHGYIIETCLDGMDNDGDGAIDIADAGCNIDSDGDGRIDAQDNCPWDPNADQADRDGDGTGDACDYDADNDGWDDFTEAEWGSNPNDAASTPEHWFVRETCEDGTDNDGDGSTDAADPGCAPDNDYDGVADAQDNCPAYWNPEQADNDSDGLGDACEDNDGDGFFDGDETAWGSDPADASSTPEGGVNYDACTDGIDNDRDGTLDGEDEGCRIYAEDGAFPPSASGPGRPVPLSSRDLTKGKTVLPVLPLAGAGPTQQNSSSSNAWWLLAASVGALAFVSGASIYGVRVRQRS